MTSSLRDRAAQASAPRPASAVGGPAPAAQQSELEEIEYTGPIKTVEQVPVHVAWSRVMADVRSIGKGNRFSGGGASYNFRGVDAVFNAVGPALRRHGLVILPAKVTPEYRDTRTSKGNAMRECTVTVDYVIYGPDGSSMTGQSQGEATDTLDKGTTKALSIAYRNFLLQALCVPTDLPEPELSDLERGERPTPRAVDYVDEVAHPRTSVGRLLQIHKELEQHNLLGAVVTNETGGEEPIGAMVKRIGAERRAAAGGEQS